MIEASNEIRKQTKFFKLNINKLLDKLKDENGDSIKFNVSQNAMVAGLNEKRFWVHIAARRTGKSYAAAIVAMAKLLEPNQKVAVVAPNYTLSNIIWDYIAQFIKELDLMDSGVEKYNQKDRVIAFKWGSVFRLLSAHNRDSLVGRAYNLIIVDEAAVIDSDDYFTRDIRPALSTYPDSRCLFISTPRGRHNYLHDYFQRGQEDSKNYDPSWGGEVFDWTSNPRLVVEDIDSARKSMTNALFKQEFMCNWLTTENMVYTVEDSRHRADLNEIKLKPLQFIAGLDIGYRDETAFVVVATDTQKWYVVDEFTCKEETTSAIADRIRELIEKYGIENIYIDSAAQQMKADFAYEYDIYCENALKDVNEGIAHVQVLLEKDRIVFDRETATESYKAIEAYAWKEKSEQPKPRHDWASHHADALRYVLYSHSKNQVDIYS